MTAYGIAHLRSVDFGPGIVEYLQCIDATLEPFDGRFIVHGAQVEVLEGQWPGDIVGYRFPRPGDGPRLVRLARLSGHPSPAHRQFAGRRDPGPRLPPRPQGRRPAGGRLKPAVRRKARSDVGTAES
jgi:hypothetical protein